MSVIQNVINDAVAFATSIANDNSHGYSQAVRSLYNFKNPTSFDCSSLVCTAYQYAFEKNGIRPTPKDMGCTYTGNMLGLLKCGFEIVATNQTGHSQMKKGDVELHELYHTALAIDGDNIVHARSSEGTSNQRDDSGNEIRIQKWYQYSKGWTHRLRFTGKGLSLQNEEIFNGVPLTEIAKYVEAEFGMAAHESYGDSGYKCLLGVAQTILDEYNHGGFGSCVADVLRINFTNPAADYSPRTLQAVRDVFINKKKRFENSDILQFRSFYSYGEEGNYSVYDKKKCAGLDAKYDYLGSDSIGSAIGHHYWGVRHKQTASEKGSKGLSYADRYDRDIEGVYVTHGGLALRNGCGTGYDSIADMPNGSRIYCGGYYTINPADGSKWYYVNYEGINGFCSSKFIRRA